MAGKIVVGVDGSGGSIRALAWALEEALHRGAHVEVVHTWQLPYIGVEAVMASVALREGDFEVAASALLDVTIAQVGPLPLGVQVERVVVHGPAAQVLKERAKDADLLVVGSRGRGGFAGLLLGAVSQQCAQHAPCPVVVVPDAADED
jgi:nucleotide-binding universal stress UspA family protein